MLKKRHENKLLRVATFGTLQNFRDVKGFGGYRRDAGGSCTESDAQQALQQTAGKHSPNAGKANKRGKMDSIVDGASSMAPQRRGNLFHRWSE